MDGETGCASSISEKQYHLTRGTSIFTAELYALNLAFKNIKDLDLNHIAIFTDSLSVVLALRNIYSTSALMNDVKDNIRECQDKDIEVVWIPSHVGLEGNEHVDGLAKEATRLENVAQIGWELGEIKNEIRKLGSLMEECKMEWLGSGIFLSGVKKETTRWKSTDQLDRRNQIVIARLRTGHTHLTHSFWMSGRNSPDICDYCNNSIISVNHILSECVSLRATRQLFNVNRESLSDDVKKNKNLMSFLHETNIYQLV